MRIVVRSDDARLVREAQGRLAAAGVEAAALPSVVRAAPDGEDVSVFCGDGAEAAAKAALAGALPPLAALVGCFAPPEFALNEATIGALALEAAPALLAAQFHEHVRLAVIEEEAVRRTATLAQLGVGALAPYAAHDLKALYVGAPSTSFLALERAFAARGGAITAAFSSFTGFDHLHDENFDAVVLNGAADPAAALSLCAALRRNASLRHLPTLMLIAASDAATTAGAYERGAAAVAAEHDACGAALAWLFEAIRRDRRRRAGEHALRAQRDLMGDPRTGLLQPASFRAHVARLAADHARSGRPFALIALRVAPALGARQPSDDAWRRGFSEIGSLAARLLREADCGAALGRDLIALALPASDLAAACGSVERIAAVAECTAFAAGDNGAGPLVFERNVVELQPGESGAGLLARALRGIEAEIMSA